MYEIARASEQVVLGEGTIVTLTISADKPPKAEGRHSPQAGGSHGPEPEGCNLA